MNKTVKIVIAAVLLVAAAALIIYNVTKGGAKPDAAGGAQEIQIPGN